MRISTRTDYGVRALIELARANRLLSAEQIATAQHISQPFLLTLLAELRRAGLVTSQRGKNGGWSLARPAQAITIADVIRAVDGPLINVHGSRPEDIDYGSAGHGLQLVWIALRSSLREVLEHVTITDVADGTLPPSIHSRTQDDEVWHSR
ncbi:Rrf2 family transcriptional regulator [Allosaccharopolyspora coralli]|uniref:Rrf2 family transcriptional regulator n=1 Tax=Allosaccharopolyspora coralli TaxID=2665642 RepID=A0A5Q3QLC6_9PSEU|nr:Rrf2 family transcriptional regulator [Allosaccharopolyspora coralli]